MDAPAPGGINFFDSIRISGQISSGNCSAADREHDRNGVTEGKHAPAQSRTDALPELADDAVPVPCIESPVLQQPHPDIAY